MRIKQPQHIIAVLKRNPPNSSRPILYATTVCCDILHLDVVHLRKMLGMVSWALSLWIARDIWWFHEEFFCKANAKPDNSKGTPSSLISQLESSSASVSAMKTLSSLWKGRKNVVLWAFFLTHAKKTPERLIAGYVMICFKYVAIVDTDARTREKVEGKVIYSRLALFTVYTPRISLTCSFPAAIFFLSPAFVFTSESTD